MEWSHMSMSEILARALLCVGCLAFTGVARAGTTTATYTATMEALSTCSVTGATVNLGAYRPTQSWADVGTAMGWYNGTYKPGTAGQEGLNFGSVTCDAGIPYTLSIKGTGPSLLGIDGAINLYLNGKVMSAWIFVKKLGATTVADSNSTFSGAGVHINYVNLAGTGTGAPQQLRGSAVMLYVTPYSTSSIQIYPLSTTGPVADNLLYTLNF